MFKVLFKVYTQYYGGEISLEEETTYECDTLEQAQERADLNCEGWRGTYVEVYLNGKYYRDYTKGRVIQQ